jgi:hypothetical protein
MMILGVALMVVWVVIWFAAVIYLFCNIDFIKGVLEQLTDDTPELSQSLPKPLEG